MVSLALAVLVTADHSLLVAPLVLSLLDRTRLRLQVVIGHLLASVVQAETVAELAELLTLVALGGLLVVRRPRALLEVCIPVAAVVAGTSVAAALRIGLPSQVVAVAGRAT